MDPISVSELAAAAGGRLVRAGDAPPGTLAGPDVVTDSRAMTSGAVFVAFVGERVDGHDYVAAAAGAGAAAALVEREVDAPLPQVVCATATEGLSNLARTVVARAKASGLVVVGVTGSSGKTSTKDLIAQVLETAGPTVAPPGSFNNEIGAPLTACRVGHDTRFLVAEMGARALGHVAWLCGITPPSIGAVLNVGHAHLGEFGTVERIALAKGELVEALDAEGWAVLNADDPRVIAMSARTVARVAAFSTAGDPGPTVGALRVWATDATPDDLQRFSFTLHAAGTTAGEAPVRLGVLGRHQVANALAAAAVGLAAGLSLPDVARALTAAIPRARLRMELGRRADGLVVLNDSYNANPDSMAAALHALAGLRRPGRRLVAVLGDMLELGPDAAAQHRRVGSLAAELGIDELLATGEFGPDLLAGFAPGGGAGQYRADKGALSALVRERATGDDVVLVKASRGLALDTVADELLADGEGGRG